MPRERSALRYVAKNAAVNPGRKFSCLILCAHPSIGGRDNPSYALDVGEASTLRRWRRGTNYLGGSMRCPFSREFAEGGPGREAPLKNVFQVLGGGGVMGLLLRGGGVSSGPGRGLAAANSGLLISDSFFASLGGTLLELGSIASNFFLSSRFREAAGRGEVRGRGSRPLRT